jgi:hypothetical protein
LIGFIADCLAALFVESKCDDERIITQNILEVKTTSPDYQGFVHTSKATSPMLTLGAVRIQRKPFEIFEIE